MYVCSFDQEIDRAVTKRGHFISLLRGEGQGETSCEFLFLIFFPKIFIKKQTIITITILMLRKFCWFSARTSNFIRKRNAWRFQGKVQQSNGRGESFSVHDNVEVLNQLGEKNAICLFRSPLTTTWMREHFSCAETRLPPKVITFPDAFLLTRLHKFSKSQMYSRRARLPLHPRSLQPESHGHSRLVHAD